MDMTRKAPIKNEADDHINLQVISVPGGSGGRCGGTTCVEGRVVPVAAAASVVVEGMEGGGGGGEGGRCKYKNQLTLVPSALGQLALLRSLNLAENRVATVADELQQCGELRELHLNGEGKGEWGGHERGRGRRAHFSRSSAE